MSDSLRPHGLQHSRPPCPSPTPGVYSNSCPSSRWCRPAISSSVVPFSSCPQSLPASGSFPMGQLFTWGGQRIRVSASTSVPPMNTWDWFPLGWTGWISLQPNMSLNNTWHHLMWFETTQMTSFLGLQPAYSLSVTENYQDVSHQHVRLQPSAPRCPRCSPLAISSRRAAGCWQCLAVVDKAGTHLASAYRTSLGTCLVASVAEGATSSVTLASENFACTSHVNL